MTTPHLPVLSPLMVEEQVRVALVEDLGRAGDITSQATIAPDMTATAEIVTREVMDAVLVPNTALRFVPPEEQKRSWLRTMMPGIPTFRAASKPEEHGPERSVWVLRDGQPVAVPGQYGAVFSFALVSVITARELLLGKADGTD